MTGILGIDIGACGALALLTPEGELVDAFDMPVLADGPSGRRAVNAPLLAELIAKSHATRAFVEYVSGREAADRGDRDEIRLRLRVQLRDTFRHAVKLHDLLSTERASA